MMMEKLNRVTALDCVSALRSCCSILQGQIIHSVIIRRELEVETSVGVALVRMYARHCCIDDAHNVYERLHVQDEVSLAAILSGYVNQGDGTKALEVFRKLYIDPDTVICICILKASSDTGAIIEGRIIHAGILEKGFDLDCVIGNALVDMYAKCSCMIDAFHVFGVIQKRDTVSWCTIITGCVDHGQHEKALQLFQNMQNEGIFPNRVTYLCLLRVCANLALLEQGRLAHSNISRCGMEWEVFVGSTLINMYAKCHCIEEARYVFDNLYSCSVVSWSVMISGYFENGQSEEALLLYRKMRGLGVEPDRCIFVCILKVCAAKFSLYDGIFHHTEIVKKGFDKDCLIRSGLIDMYNKLGMTEDANRTSDVMSIQDVNGWSAVIMRQLKHGHDEMSFMLFEKMMALGNQPYSMILMAFLKACSLSGGLDQGRFMHFEIIKRGLDADIYVSSSLLNMYASCGCIIDARCVLNSTRLPNVALWNIMISRLADLGRPEEAVKSFGEMQRTGIQANRVTALCILKACSCIGTLEQGHLVHSCIVLHGLDSSLCVGNALIDMYAKCGNAEDALNVFNDLEERDVVSWTAIITADDQHNALELFEKMQHENIRPNELTFVCVLHALANLMDPYQCAFVHHHIVHTGFESNHHIACSLIDAYAKHGNLDDAFQVFDNMPMKNLVAWSTVLSACVRYGYDYNVFHLLEEMEMQGIEPNEIVYITVLDAFSNTGALDLGMLVHITMVKRGLDLDSYAGNMLVGMYSRCGTVQDALKLFETLPFQTLISWNAVISGLADHGDCDKLQGYANKMEQNGMKADSITLMSMISVCNHGGLVENGCRLLQEMKHNGMVPCVEHYVSMVDMLGRAGQLLEAEEIIQRLPFHPSMLTCMVLLGASVKYSNVDVGRRAFGCLLESNCKSDAAYVLMSNMYSANGMWERAKRIRKEMAEDMEFVIIS